VSLRQNSLYTLKGNKFILPALSNAELLRTSFVDKNGIFRNSASLIRDLIIRQVRGVSGRTPVPVLCLKQRVPYHHSSLIFECELAFELF
jgi:hypothetical protein